MLAHVAFIQNLKDLKDLKDRRIKAPRSETFLSSSILRVVCGMLRHLRVSPLTVRFCSPAFVYENCESDFNCE